MRSFEHLDERWQVRGLGSGHGSSVHTPPKRADLWAVEFRSLTAQDRTVVSDYISDADPTSVPREELERALERALIIETLETAAEGMTASEIAGVINLPEERIRIRTGGMSHRVDWDDSETDPRYRMR